MFQTQLSKIQEKLKKDGVMSNRWAVDHGIFRASERIRELQEVGYVFEKVRGKGRQRGLYFYYLVGKK